MQTLYECCVVYTRKVCERSSDIRSALGHRRLAIDTVEMVMAWVIDVRSMSLLTQ